MFENGVLVYENFGKYLQYYGYINEHMYFEWMNNLVIWLTHLQRIRNIN